MYLMSSTGYIDRADHAIFADPGREKPRTYELVDWLQDWQQANDGIPFHYVQSTLYDDLMNQENSTGQRLASIPAFTKGGGGMLRRQCTREYKIDVVHRKIRELHGLKPRQWMKPTEIWLGISTDEITRAKENPKARLTNVYPLLDLNFSRSDCRNWLRENGFPIPPKSACVFCPYQGNAEWRDLKENDPEEFQIAVEVDRQIRDSSKQGVKEPIYLHRSCQPLDEVDFDSDQIDLFDAECTGHCGL